MPHGPGRTTGSRTPSKSPVAARLRPRPAKHAGLPVGARIVRYLTANKGKQFTAVQIAEALARRIKSVKPSNVQRRLHSWSSASRLDGRTAIMGWRRPKLAERGNERRHSSQPSHRTIASARFASSANSSNALSLISPDDPLDLAAEGNGDSY